MTREHRIAAINTASALTRTLTSPHKLDRIARSVMRLTRQETIQQARGALDRVRS